MLSSATRLSLRKKLRARQVQPYPVELARSRYNELCNKSINPCPTDFRPQRRRLSQNMALSKERRDLKPAPPQASHNLATLSCKSFCAGLRPVTSVPLMDLTRQPRFTPKISACPFLSTIFSRRPLPGRPGRSSRRHSWPSRNPPSSS